MRISKNDIPVRINAPGASRGAGSRHRSLKLHGSRALSYLYWAASPLKALVLTLVAAANDLASHLVQHVVYDFTMLVLWTE